MKPRRRRSSLALAAVAALLVTGCGASEPEPVRDPYSVDGSLPVVDTSGMRLPTPFEELEVVDPGWDITPQYADGVYLAAGERDGVLEFTAVDVHGDVLWAAQRPASCTGFVVTTDAHGRALAILGDLQTTADALAATTATAYDLTTGERVWGPVEVPGPYQGPGLVFAAPPEGFMGETGPRVALDPTTGDVAADESSPEGIRIIGEYHGIVLLTHEDALIARDTADDQELWRVPLAEHGWTAASISASLRPAPGDGLALVATSETTGALLDLDQGSIVSSTARDAAVDPPRGPSSPWTTPACTAMTPTTDRCGPCLLPPRPPSRRSAASSSICERTGRSGSTTSSPVMSPKPTNPTAKDRSSCPPTSPSTALHSSSRNDGTWWRRSLSPL